MKAPIISRSSFYSATNLHLFLLSLNAWNRTTRSGSNGDRLSTLAISEGKNGVLFQLAVQTLPPCNHANENLLCSDSIHVHEKRKRRAERLVESSWIVVVGSAVGHIVYALAHEDKCMENLHIWRVHLHAMSHESSVDVPAYKVYKWWRKWSFISIKLKKVMIE